ncbi:hypothetical protein V3429_18520 [Aeromonas jandaei]|uniref:Uncharacterized protein n=1 Tax=Aeromonas jandaei TaxID=650 RepID=A0ABD7ERF4_AERJA|nr:MULTISPECIES: hypothetical protein [Aeromonas]MBL0609165.1 hypothetical protein [Aeromonas jandaei]MBL0665416.1 hypothetical protein [Aeromonas jandaei]MCQ4054242.1 hypothetical protein [Aeromonas sp. SG16]PPA30937.1 hypothetical protein C3737_01705 [Aeromonas jandaei]QNF15660.1 hypothetical protein FT670_21530 [Aeromonas jandaei]
MKDDKITNLRAPMVTANGIILGFLLNYMATWVRGDVEHVGSAWQAYLIGMCVFSGTVSMIFVLFRILSVRQDDDALTYYRHTLYLFIFGISIAFFGVFFDMFMTFMVE